MSHGAEWALAAAIFVTLSVWIGKGVASPSRGDGGYGGAKGQIANLEAALDNYELDCGRYPTTAEGLDALRIAPAGVKGWKGPYLRKDVPPDPWDHPYVYKSPGLHGDRSAASYDLSSNGPDGVEGTDDDTQSWAMTKR